MNIFPTAQVGKRARPDLYRNAGWKGVTFQIPKGHDSPRIANHLDEGLWRHRASQRPRAWAHHRHARQLASRWLKRGAWTLRSHGRLVECRRPCAGTCQR